MASWPVFNDHYSNSPISSSGFECNKTHYFLSCSFLFIIDLFIVCFSNVELKIYFSNVELKITGDFLMNLPMPEPCLNLELNN